MTQPINSPVLRLQLTKRVDRQRHWLSHSLHPRGRHRFCELRQPLTEFANNFSATCSGQVSREQNYSYDLAEISFIRAVWPKVHLPITSLMTPQETPPPSQHTRVFADTYTRPSMQLERLLDRLQSQGPVGPLPPIRMTLLATR